MMVEVNQDDDKLEKKRKVRFSAYETGPSGSSGQGILKADPHHSPPPPRRVKALNFEPPASPVQDRKPLPSPTSSVSRPFTSLASASLTRMDYYSAKPSYRIGDDAYAGSMRSRSLASNTLDENDLISRRSRLADARVLGNISYTMDAMNSAFLPPPVPKPVKPVRRPPAKRVIVSAGGRPTNIKAGHINADYIYPIHNRTSHIVYEAPVHFEVHRSRSEPPVDLPRAVESINNLKRHVGDIRAGLGSQRILLDRYLPIDMGATPTVDQGINKKYYELAVRMPNLEPETYRKRSYLQDECAVRLMTPQAMRSQSVEPDLLRWRSFVRAGDEPRQVGSTHAPMSETRKNLRRIITKGRRDPYFYQ